MNDKRMSVVKLKAGDRAPDFSGKDQNGNTVSLTGLKGKRVVLYFYPKDVTPGCTAQACNLGENQSLLKKHGFEVVGVSADTEASHRKFADKYHLPFALLADTDHAIIQAYGVWGPKKFMGRTFDGIHRTTFVIGTDGNLESVITKVDTKEHTEQILNELGINP